MSNNFESLQSDEVVSVEDDLNVLVGHPTFKVREFKKTLMQILYDYYTSGFRGGQENEKLKGFFIQGMNAQVLKYGANSWQKGKVRIKFTLEFCPDEPEVKNISTPNPPETSEPESPLDEIRRMQG